MRRAATRLLPRLLAAAGPEAAIAAQQGEATLLPRLAAAAASNQAHAAAWQRGFRSSVAFQSQLAEALRGELAYEKENYEQPAELSVGPPAGFSLQEAPGDTLMVLEKKYGAETVTIEVMVNDQPEEELVEGEGGELDADVGAVFTATVTKGDKSLVFECKSDGQYFVILHASLEPASGEIEDSTYTGPVYEELDEELQRQFENYLAERGVGPEIGAYVLPLVHDKEQREYTNWLQHVHDFVQK